MRPATMANVAFRITKFTYRGPRIFMNSDLVPGDSLDIPGPRIETISTLAPIQSTIDPMWMKSNARKIRSLKFNFDLRSVGI